MKTFKILQTTKQHNVNHLHNAFVAAGITPLSVQSSGTESIATFDDEVSDTAIQAVITNYVFVAPPAPADLVAMAQAYRTKVTAITNLADAKALLNGELYQILKYLALRDVDIGN